MLKLLVTFFTFLYINCYAKDSVPDTLPKDLTEINRKAVFVNEEDGAHIADFLEIGDSNIYIGARHAMHFSYLEGKPEYFLGIYDDFGNSLDVLFAFYEGSAFKNKDVPFAENFIYELLKPNSISPHNGDKWVSIQFEPSKVDPAAKGALKKSKSIVMGVNKEPGYFYIGHEIIWEGVLPLKLKFDGNETSPGSSGSPVYILDAEGVYKIAGIIVCEFLDEEKTYIPIPGQKELTVYRKTHKVLSIDSIIKQASVDEIGLEFFSFFGGGDSNPPLHDPRCKPIDSRDGD